MEVVIDISLIYSYGFVRSLFRLVLMSRFRAWPMVAHFVVSVKVTLTAVFDLSSAHVSRSTSIAAAVGKLPCKRYS